MSTSDQGFVQDYQLGREQELFIYCRLCRRAFPVRFRPKTRKARLRCFCGHEAPLDELDVFASEAEAREHAQLYEKIYRAAKDALKDAGVPLPPSGKYAKPADLDESSFISYYDEREDASAIEHAYLEPDSEEGRAPGANAEELVDLETRLEEATGALARHEVLSELVEWTFVRRNLDPGLRRRLREACQEDIALAPRVVKEAKQRVADGEKVRLSFTSFKHYALDLEEEGELAAALDVVRKAAALGLKGYEERAQELLRALGRG